LRAEPFDEARGLRVRALAREGHDRDFIALHLINVPHDDAVHARAPLDRLKSPDLSTEPRRTSVLMTATLPDTCWSTIVACFRSATRRCNSFSIAALPAQGVQNRPPYCTIASSLYKASAAATSPRLSASTSF